MINLWLGKNWRSRRTYKTDEKLWDSGRNNCRLKALFKSISVTYNWKCCKLLCFKCHEIQHWLWHHQFIIPVLLRVELSLVEDGDDDEDVADDDGGHQEGGGGADGHHVQKGVAARSRVAVAVLPDGEIWSLPFLGLGQGGGCGGAIKEKEWIHFCSVA